MHLFLHLVQVMPLALRLLPSIGAGGICASSLYRWSPCLWGLFFIWLVQAVSLFWGLTSYSLFRWCLCQKPPPVQSVQAVSAFLGAANAREGWGWQEEVALWLTRPNWDMVVERPDYRCLACWQNSGAVISRGEVWGLELVLSQVGDQSLSTLYSQFRWYLCH